MLNRQNTRLLVFGLFAVVGLAILFGLRTLDLGTQHAATWLSIAAAVLGMVIVGGAWVLLRSMAHPDGTRFLSESVALIEQGHAQRVLETARQRRAVSDQQPGAQRSRPPSEGERPEFALAQALALVHLGHGPQAQQAVREALALLRPAAAAPDAMSRPAARSGTWLDDLAHVTLFNAQVVSGEFVRAANELAQYAADSTLQPHYAQTLVAFAYFLADEPDRARAALERMPETAKTARYLSTKYQYMLALVRAALLGEQPELGPLNAELETWRDEARRNAHNTYGRRLAAVLTQRPV